MSITVHVYNIYNCTHVYCIYMFCEDPKQYIPSCCVACNTDFGFLPTDRDHLATDHQIIWGKEQNNLSFENQVLPE